MKRAGFSLVELLTVVAIVSIISGIMFPAFTQAREEARRTSCMSNVMQIARAQAMYIDDYDGKLLGWYRWEGSRVVYWTEMLWPYLRSGGVFNCPDYRNEGPKDKIADYAMMSWGQGGSGSKDDPTWRWAGPPMQLADVRRPSETYTILDGFTQPNYTRGLMLRHSPGGCLAAFLDGHSRYITLQQSERVDQDEQGRFYYVFASADK